jgi:hypothetical protein
MGSREWWRHWHSYPLLFVVVFIVSLVLSHEKI